MPKTIGLFESNSKDWDRWRYRAPHDFYHSAAYHAFAERMGEGKAWLAVAGSPKQFLAWPYLTRSIGNTWSDATSVYGYSGPFGQGIDDNFFVREAWSSLKAVWAEQRIVTVFTRFHPILGYSRLGSVLHGARYPAGGELVHLGRSVSIDLALSRDARRAAYPKILRQEIQAAERAGMYVESDIDWTHYSDFVTLYRKTMERNDASTAYQFSDRYFADLRIALQSIAYLAVAYFDGEVAAALIFTICGDIAQAHLTGVNPRYKSYSPLKCLIDNTASIAAERGARLLHLGAGRGGAEDSLFAFKSRFSSVRHDFLVGRWILDAQQYDALLQQRGVNAELETRYFPAYRAP